MTSPETRFGRPFDLLLLCGAQTESGRSLHDITDVAPVVAEAALVLADTPLRDAASGLANNVFRRLEELTPDGEPTAWGSVGIVNWSFCGGAVAAYFTQKCAAVLIDGWLREPDQGEVERRVKPVGHASHMADVDELMRFVQEEEGRPRLGDYGKEVVRALKGSRVRAPALPDRLRTFEETFEGRTRTALREAARAAGDAAITYVSCLEHQFKDWVDEAGFASGLSLVVAALSHTGAVQATLESQRDAMREPLAEAESEAARAFEALAAACARSRLGWLRPLRKHLSAYLAAATMAFRLRFAFDLTQEVLAALSECRAGLDQRRLLLEATIDNFALTRGRCLRLVDAFEKRETTPVSEIIDRPLYTVNQLHRLYHNVYGAHWDALPPNLEGMIRQSAGGLSRWIGHGAEELYQELTNAVRPAFDLTARMTADEFVRWLVDRGEASPGLLVRDSEELAPALCRYDRARLPDSGAFEDTSFRIMGVPDRDTSVFAGVGDTLLVSTGDPDRIVYVSIKLGLPASALWHFERYQRASDDVGRRGRVALRIYPGFPGDSVWGGGAGKRGRRQARSADSRNGRSREADR